MLYLFKNRGCDETCYFSLELTDEELEVIKRFMQANNDAPTYDSGCFPMLIFEHNRNADYIAELLNREIGISDD